MMTAKLNFNKKTILITGGAGFIGSNLAFYFQENFSEARIIIFDCFRNYETFNNGNLKSFGHYKNLIGFKGDVICGNINSKNDLLLLKNYTSLSLFITLIINLNFFAISNLSIFFTNISDDLLKKKLAIFSL